MKTDHISKIKRIPRKDLKCQTQFKPSPTPSFAKTLLNPSVLRSDPVPNEEYCELSISYTAEEICPERSAREENLIKSAKQSIIELQNEVKSCMSSSKKIFAHSSKKNKQSEVAFQYNNPNPQLLISTLSSSIQSLSSRLKRSEVEISEQIEENSNLKLDLFELQEKVKTRLETNAVNACCSIGCMLM